jgi:hypothetical protein
MSDTSEMTPPQGANTAPETGSEQYRARRAQHKFLQAGAPTRHTMPFNQLSAPQQTMLVKRCRLASGQELPIAVCYLDQDSWCLITTRRVHWSTRGLYKSLLYSEIKQVGWSAGPTAARRRTHADQIDLWMHTEEGKISTKTGSPWFFIFEKSGVRHELRLEVGNPLTAMWDCIDMLIRLEQIHPRQEDG